MESPQLVRLVTVQSLAPHLLCLTPSTMAVVSGPTKVKAFLPTRPAHENWTNVLLAREILIVVLA